MKHSKLVRALTLIGFTLLLCGFLLYRGHYFDSFLFHRSEKNINEKILPGNDPDSLNKKRDSSPHLRLPSSKTIVLSDDNLYKDDTMRKKRDTAKLKKEKLLILSSSKSASGIVEPSLFEQDSLKKEPLIKPVKKEKQP